MVTLSGWPLISTLYSSLFPVCVHGLRIFAYCYCKKNLRYLFSASFRSFSCSLVYTPNTVLQHRSQAVILVLLLVPTHFPSFYMICFSEYIRHTWQRSFLLDQTNNMNFSLPPLPEGTRFYQVRGEVR